MNKLVVTRWKGQILTAYLQGGRCRFLNLEREEQESLLGNIYIGKVKNVIKNINAAFIDLGKGRTGFYSLTENKEHLFSDSSLCPGDGQNPARTPKPGDELVIQVARDAVKTKDPVLSCYLNVTGKYAVLTLGKGQIGFSAKLHNGAWKEEVREYLTDFVDERFGIIVRTNAGEVSKEIIGDEVEFLKQRLFSLLEKAKSRTCFSLLDGAEPYFILSLRDSYADQLEAVETDDRACFERMRAYLELNQKRDLDKLKLYEDPQLPLIKLHSLETAIEEAAGRKVWLKSGGYLVIEPTEALTVIDVNTGKYAGKKNAEDTILKINLEAAVETARQLSLRNLSGIIVVDFIDMASEAHKKMLLDCLETELKKDPIKSVLVEMTKLGLVEITRKKVRKPFHEMMRP